MTTPDPSLDMTDRDTLQVGSGTPGDGTHGVPVHHDTMNAIDPEIEQKGVNPQDHGRDVVVEVTGRDEPEINVGGGEPGHEAGVLPGVDVEDDAIEGSEPSDDGPDLDALRPGPGEKEEVLAVHAESLPDLTALEKAQAALAEWHDLGPNVIAKRRSLTEWMRVYAAWYAQQPRQPGLTDRIRAVRAITQYKVTKKALAALEARADWRRFVEKCRADAAFRAKTMLESHYAFYVDLHKQGAQMALKAGDHRAIPTFTSPVLERVAPKRVESDAPPPSIVLNLSVQQMKGVEAVLSAPVKADVVEDADFTIEETS